MSHERLLISFRTFRRLPITAVGQIYFHAVGTGYQCLVTWQSCAKNPKPNLSSRGDLQWNYRNLYRLPLPFSKKRLWRMSVSSEYWLISAPGDKTPQQTYVHLKGRMNGLSPVFQLHIPELKVWNKAEIIFQLPWLMGELCWTVTW